MYTFLTFLVLILTIVLFFFLPELSASSLKHALLIGAITFFVISRKLKKEWKLRMENIQKKVGNPYSKIKELGESPDFLMNLPDNLRQMDNLSQGDIGHGQMGFTSFALVWFCIWLIVAF